MTDEDLANNRRGLLGPTQRADLAAFANLGGFVARSLGAGDMTARVGHDLAQGRVATADGQVVWVAGLPDPHPYGAVVSGAPSPLRISSRLPLVPGPYRFYYLPGSGLVVGAEAPGAPAHAPLQWTPAHREAYARTLAGIFGLPPDALDANRRGQLVEVQRARLAAKARRAVNGVFALIAGALVATLVALYAWQLGKAWPVPLLLGGVLVVAAVVRARAAANLRQDAREGSLGAVDGALARGQRGTRGVIHWLRVGPEEFILDDALEVWWASVPGTQMRAYAGRRSRELVGLDPLGF